MVNYHICPVCREPIEVEKFREHFKKHGTKKDKADSTRLKQILDDSGKSWDRKTGNPISLFFEIAGRVFSQVEKIDTSSWNYIFDYEVPEIVADLR
jgi:hypothetical protein